MTLTLDVLAKRVTVLDETGSDYTGTLPAGLPASPNEGDHVFVDYDNGKLTLVYDADSGQWQPVFVSNLPSGSLTDNGDGTYTGTGAIASVDTRADSNPATTTGTNLTATTSGGQIKELANKERAFQNSGSAESATNDESVPGDGRCFQNRPNSYRCGLL